MRTATRPRSRLLAGLVGLVAVVMGAAAADAASMSVTWTAPTTNADGSRLSDLAGYRVYLGTSNPQCPGPSFFDDTRPHQRLGRWLRSGSKLS